MSRGSRRPASSFYLFGRFQISSHDNVLQTLRVTEVTVVQFQFLADCRQIRRKHNSSWKRQSRHLRAGGRQGQDRSDWTADREALSVALRTQVTPRARTPRAPRAKQHPHIPRSMAGRRVCACAELLCQCSRRSACARLLETAARVGPAPAASITTALATEVLGRCC